MSRWSRQVSAAGIIGLTMLALGQARAIEPFAQQYKVYWYGIPVGDAAISLSPVEGAHYQFRMRVKDHVPFYEMDLDSSTLFHLRAGKLIPEQAWIKGRSEGENHDVRFHYQDGQLAQIDGFDKAVPITPLLIDYITFVATLAVDFSSQSGIHHYTVLTERGKINQHRFTISGSGMVGGRLVHFVTELDNKNRTEMEVVADTGLIRHFTKYRNDKKRLEFIPK